MKFNCVFSLILASFLFSPCQADGIFQIGNSLSWDTRPGDRDGLNEWHIFCNRNLQFIYDNPTGHCINSSIPWTVALAENSYEFVIVQPFVGTTLEQDRAIIAEWMQMQPDATFVIHPGWTTFRTFANDYVSQNDGMMKPSVAYIDDLISALPSDRNILSTRSHDVLFDIHQDIEAGTAPFSQLSDLYRDDIHMSWNVGRYLMHNVTRKAMGQPINDDDFNLDANIRSYLKSKIRAIPEPMTSTMLGVTCALIALRRRRT